MNKLFYEEFNALQNTYTKREYVSMWIGAIAITICIGITIVLASVAVTP